MVSGEYVASKFAFFLKMGVNLIEKRAYTCRGNDVWNLVIQEEPYKVQICS